MPDNRPLREKLQAMADQTESPNEAEIARELIKQMLGIDQPTPIKTEGRVLDRDSILGTPDRENIGGTKRLRTKDGTWYTIDLDEIDIRITPDDLF